MDIIRKNIFLYTVIVIIPTLAAFFIFQQYLEVQEEENIKEETANFGRLHQQYLEKLIIETMKSLDILSIVAIDSIDDQEHMTQLLTKTKRTDKRYGDLYHVDYDGIIVSGSTNIYNGIKVEDNYINKCSSLKKTYVSSEKETDPYNLDFFFICKPLLEDNNSISGYLIASLRLDYIENVLEMLTPQIAVKITDLKNKEILSINEHLKIGDYQQSIPFEYVPWKLHLNHSPAYIGINTNALLKFIVVFLFFTHMIFLAVQFILLKRDALKQKKNYDNQKLEMIGTLAATTAHEIKNPLTGIKGLVQLLSEKHSDSKDQMYFSVIQKEIKRINEIVNEFLVLGKPSAYPLEEVDLLEVLEEILPIMESEATTHVTRLRVELGGRPLPILCFKDQIKQVILNIAKNSFESCRPNDQVIIRLTTDSTYATITIQDTGIGMTKDTLRKIFEPFFTTKEYGTGLGLYICKKIISIYKGTITINSKRNVGTTVKIILPLKEKIEQ